jgi:hypothetical protein
MLVGLAGMFMLAQSLYAQKSGLTYTIAFNGYCDGATITVGTNGFVTGTHDNYDCAGDNTWVDGITSLPVGKFDGEEAIGPVSLADNLGVVDAGDFADGAVVLYLNFTTKTFSFYTEITGDGSEQYDNSGTFTIVEEAAASRSGAPSWKKHSAVISLPFFSVSGYPTGTYDLLLYQSGSAAEYCDFFTLTANGDRVGGVHNFTASCGEPANAAAGGNYSFLGTGVITMTNAQGNPIGVGGGRGLFTTDNADEVLFAVDYTENYYFDFQSRLWTVYDTNGTTGLELVNWGTFSVVEDDPLTGKTATLPVGGIRSNTPHQK